MRTFLAIMLFFMAPSLSGARASDLVPLDKYIIENNTSDKGSAVYLFLRCAAQLTYVSMLMEGRAPDKAKMLISRSEELLATASELKVELSNIPLDKAMSLNLTAIQKLMEHHTETGNSNYLKTGSYFSDADWTNINICSKLVGASTE